MNLYIALAPMSGFLLWAFYLANRSNQLWRLIFIIALACYISWLGFLAPGVLGAVLAAAICLLLVCASDGLARMVLGGGFESNWQPIAYFLTKVCRLSDRFLLMLARVLWCVSLCAIFAVGLHLLPGGESWQLSPPVRLGAAQVDWLWRVKLFNALLGIGLIVLFYRPKSLSLQGIAITLAISAAVIVLALMVGGWLNSWRWDPKLHSLWPWFCLLMLSFTVIPEEAFFRYCIQAPLYKYLGTASLLITALIFGLSHLGGGFVYASVAVVAGLGYAFIWHRFQDLLLSSACHWLVNLMHFSLLTYPY